MASRGIRDRVAIVGMGCTTFGEHWDRSVDDMLVDATTDTVASAGVKLDDIDAF
ncbi:MAG TPA: acetyl-CoA acetyltransferase, partial [Acidimicrobiia bacterium]